MVGVCVASHRINVFLLGISECAVVLGVLTHPHVLPETHHTNRTHAQTKLPIFPYLWCMTGHHLIIAINTCRARSGWTSIVYCFRTIVIVSCLFIYKCTVAPVVPDFRVACILPSLLNCNY